MAVGNQRSAASPSTLGTVLPPSSSPNGGANSLFRLSSLLSTVIVRALGLVYWSVFVHLSVTWFEVILKVIETIPYSLLPPNTPHHIQAKFNCSSVGTMRVVRVDSPSYCLTLYHYRGSTKSGYFFSVSVMAMHGRATSDS